MPCHNVRQSLTEPIPYLVGMLFPDVSRNGKQLAWPSFDQRERYLDVRVGALKSCDGIAGLRASVPSPESAGHGLERDHQCDMVPTGKLGVGIEDLFEVRLLRHGPDRKEGRR